MTEEKKVLTRDEILGAKDCEVEQVDAPEWGGSVYVRGMTGIQRDRMEILLQEGSHSLENIRAVVAAMCLCDSRGERIFKDRDAMELGGKSAKPLHRVFAAIMRLSALRKEDLEAVQGNLPKGLSEDSTSA